MRALRLLPPFAFSLGIALAGEEKEMSLVSSLDWTERAAFLFCQALKARKRRAMATTTQSVAVSTIRCVSIRGFSELSEEVGESEAVGRPGLPLHIVKSAELD